jgi:two-component system CheB/CheR fusion protein
VLDQFAPAFVVVDRDGEVLHQSARLGTYLEPAVGAPTRQLLALARHGLRPALRAALREALATGQRVVRPHVEVELEERVQPIVLTVAPLPQRDLPEALFVVTFADLGPPVVAERPGAVAGMAEDGALAQLERDMREMRERLQSTIEEYETATEELTSANEELVSVNEELQSTNEELETSKEEQQSVNEELRTVNLELSAKLEELDRANADLRNLFESTRIATIFLDRHMLIRSFTPAISAIVNLQPGDRGRPLTDFAHRLDQVDFRQDVARMLQRQEPFERRVAMRDGGAQYLMRLLPYRTTDGAVDGAVMTFIDVSGVVEAEILATMVAELNHRVRNMLQVVMAVFQRTLRRSGSLEDFAVAFRGRVMALARAHELVSAAGWNPVALRELALKELDPYADSKARIQLEGPAASLTPRIALALGMVLHELATNASKYGALSVPRGHVTITWSLEGPAAKGLRLRWSETGGPPVVPPRRRGFGTELIDRQVRHDLRGTVGIEFAPEGLRAALAFPLDLPLGG